VFTGAVRVASILASHHGEAAPNLLDGRLESSWYTSGPQDGSEVLELDLGSPQADGGLELILANAIHYPRLLNIDVKQDAGWTTAWSGPTSALALDASLQSQRTSAPMVIDLGHHVTSAIRLRQTGQHRGAAWSMSEVRVLRR
jgi:hypothetical protein